jgi:hypothetical protein
MVYAAIEALRTSKPRVLYIMLGDGDEWAHEGRYDLYLDAAQRGNIAAMINLAVLLYRAHENNDAEYWWQHAAEAGDTDAMHALAFMLDKSRRFDEALVWYHNAAEAGHTDAMHNLAIRLRYRGQLTGVIVDEYQGIHPDSQHLGHFTHPQSLVRPADRPGSRLDVDWLKAAIQRRWGRDHSIRHGVYPGGHAGAAVAISQLSTHLARQKESVAVIVSADALTALPTLAHLERAGRLKSPSRPRGAIAGEAAVALVIEPVGGIGHDDAYHCRSALAATSVGRDHVSRSADARWHQSAVGS